ncbi:MAG: endolytic transglycosylase MltG [Candidatus Paceibacterota bacterium]
MHRSKHRTLLASIFGVLLILGFLVLLGNTLLFAPVDRGAEVERFTVPFNSYDEDTLILNLKYAGFIRSELGFRMTLLRERIDLEQVEPGAYRISKAMNTKEIAKTLEGEPYMKWVFIPEGYRKEQIAEQMQEILGWSDSEVSRWLTVDTNTSEEYREGVYYPDTYLIPLDESPSDVAERLRRRFNEVYGEFSEEALQQNIKWTTVVKLASLIQREAGGVHDMSLIAGVLWNRLDVGMRLQVDATLQYIRGTKENGWWAIARSEDKFIDSPFNTYANSGLPPYPIANPGRDALRAVLFPEVTDCLFYLHNSDGDIFCSVTYEEHLENIETQLRGR